MSLTIITQKEIDFLDYLFLIIEHSMSVNSSLRRLKPYVYSYVKLGIKVNEIKPSVHDFNAEEIVIIKSLLKQFLQNQFIFNQRLEIRNKKPIFVSVYSSNVITLLIKNHL